MDIDYEALCREIERQMKFDYEFWWGEQWEHEAK